MLQLPNQIAIDDRPGQLAPQLEALRAYERDNAEALARAEAERKRLKREQTTLVILGMLAVFGGFLLGGGLHPILFLISLVGVGLLIWSAQGPGKRLRVIENSPAADVTGRCAAAAGLLSDLRDDLARSRRIDGQVDLRPIESAGQVARERPGKGGVTVRYFYHTWLTLGLHLADGNELRLVAVERLKLRPGHNRRGSVSGKQKWKPAQRSYRQRLALRLRLRPDVYDGAASRLPAAPAQVGGFSILRAELRGGELRLLAECEADRLAARDVIGLLRQLYAGLSRRPLA